jgi:hypothetical protein
VAGIEIATPLPTNSAEHRNAVQSDALLAGADRNPQPLSITNHPLNRWKRSHLRALREVATLPAVIGESQMHHREMASPVHGVDVIPNDAKSQLRNAPEAEDLPPIEMTASQRNQLGDGPGLAETKGDQTRNCCANAPPPASVQGSTISNMTMHRRSDRIATSRSMATKSLAKSDRLASDVRVDAGRATPKVRSHLAAMKNRQRKKIAKPSRRLPAMARFRPGLTPWAGWWQQTWKTMLAIATPMVAGADAVDAPRTSR